LGTRLDKLLKKVVLGHTNVGSSQKIFQNSRVIMILTLVLLQAH